MRRLVTTRNALLVAALVGIFAVAAAAAVDRSPTRASAPPPQVAVTVGGRRVLVPPGTTLRRATSMLRLRPQAGDLLDVGGRVLWRGVFAGKLLLNGEPAAPRTRLHRGDRIRVVDGRDRRERVVTDVVQIRRGVTPNPQFILGRVPGSQVIVRGAVSHRLASVRFRPRGPELIEPAVALTFDDGPSPRYTPRVLAVLRRLHVPATFFAIGSLARERPDLIRAELLAGMTVENHSDSHPQPFAQLPRSAIADEIAVGAASLRPVGADATLFRPPGGSVSPEVVSAARSLGQRTVLWSVDPGDWHHGATPRGIARKVLAAVRPGSIVLLHDGGGDRSATVAALPTIIRGIRSRGLDLVALPMPAAEPIKRERWCLRLRTPAGRARTAVCR